MPIADDVILGERVEIRYPDLVNLFGCVIGSDSMIGPFVEIQAGVTIGVRCRIQSHTAICEGVSIGDDVFVGHGVVFTNDRYPRASGHDGRRLQRSDWNLEKTVVGSRVSLGSGSVLLPGLVIGDGAMVGAGAVVTRDVEPGAVVAGNPAKVVR